MSTTQIDLEGLLYGSPSWTEVVEYFKHGEFYETPFEVRAIQRWLMTDEQSTLLKAANLSLHDILCGDYREEHEEMVMEFFDHWNTVLGHKRYG
jgi:hypothetical protein